MFRSLRQAEVVEISNPPVGPVNYTHEIIQDNRELGLLFEEGQLAEAEETVVSINNAVHRRIVALRSVAAISLIAASVTVGWATVNRSGHSAPEVDGSTTPVPTATHDATSTPTPSLTPNPQPHEKYKLSPVRLTLSPKPQQPHHATTHIVHTPEAPVSTYTPPETTYTPPPPPAPHLTIHRLKEKH